MDKASIVKISETFRIDEAGGTVKVVVVLWTLGRHGPFSFEIPEGQFTGAAAKAEMERRAAELRSVLEP